MDVAVATPNVGVVKLGESNNANVPAPEGKVTENAVELFVPIKEMLPLVAIVV